MLLVVGVVHLAGDWVSKVVKKQRGLLGMRHSLLRLLLLLLLLLLNGLVILLQLLHLLFSKPAILLRSLLLSRREGCSYQELRFPCCRTC